MLDLLNDNKNTPARLRAQVATAARLPESVLFATRPITNSQDVDKAVLRYAAMIQTNTNHYFGYDPYNSHAYEISRHG